MARFDYRSGEKERLDESKKEVCMVLRRSMARKPHYSVTRLAIELRTSRARVSQVQCADVTRLTFNQLFRYLIRLEPKLQILVAI